MKKLTLALSAVITLTAIWTGGAWYTGKVAEAEFQSQVQRANTEIAKALSANDVRIQVKMDNVRFQRGWFVSEVSYDTVVELPDEKVSVPFNGELYHGPLPLNQIKRFDFAPAIFSAELEIARNDVTKDWFASEQSPLKNAFTLSYGQRLKGKTEANLRDAKLGEGEYFTLNLSGRYELDKNGNNSKANIKVKEFTRKGIKPNATPEEVAEYVIQLKNAELAVETGERSAELPNVFDLNYQFKADEIHLSGQTQQDEGVPITVKNAKFDFFAKVKDSVVDYRIDNNADSLHYDEINLGKLINHWEFNHLDAKAMNTLISEAQAYPDKTLSPAAETALSTIIKHQPQLKIDPMLLIREQGNLEMKANVALAEIDLAHLSQSNVLAVFSALNWTVEVNKAALKDLLSAVAQKKDQLPKNEADKQADALLSDFIMQAKNNNFLTEDETSLKLVLNLEKDGLHFNGTKLSEKEVQMLLFALMMNLEQ
ncbi:YdgA family protein [Exercitatus varius]|uniref:YdgA family protein n=1 Tax=Exercitatus varius TaxID=67857 RepID=UPI00294B58B3|nr:YdgA family protein [Exercitatus varius]MDG2951322.1 YdgA family protein [Exercitatus varius]